VGIPLFGANLLQIERRKVLGGGSGIAAAM
jgi:hypothetical protein